MKTHPLPPFLFPSSDASQRIWMAQLKKKGLIRALGPRLYTSLPENEVKNAVRGNWAHIVSNLFPNSLLSHRSALEYRPTPDGEIFLTSSTNREVRYPGLILKFNRGSGPLKS